MIIYGFAGIRVDTENKFERYHKHRFPKMEQKRKGTNYDSMVQRKAGMGTSAMGTSAMGDIFIKGKGTYPG